MIRNQKTNEKRKWHTGVRMFAVVLIIALFFIPSVQRYLAYRWDIIVAEVRGITNPVQPMPTANTTDLAIPVTGLASVTPSPTMMKVAPTITSAEMPTLTPTLTPTMLPQKTLIPPPSFKTHDIQDLNNCGPAALALYMRYYGWEGDQYTISDEIKPIRADRNTNVEELAYYVRTKVGWLNVEYRVGGSKNLLRQFLAAGIPVMIETSLLVDKNYYANDDRWAGHYQLITGYDDVLQTFIVQDVYVGPNQKMAYQTLDKNWQTFNRVFILVYPNEQVDTVKKLLGSDWDGDVNRQNALDTSQKESEEDPKNAFAWFNLGSNMVYFERYTEAAQAYDQARALGLPQRMLRYQFGPFLAYFHTNHTEELLTLTEYALERTPNSEEALLWKGWAMVRMGKNQEAAELFRQALKEHPGYLDAQYALNYLGM